MSILRERLLLWRQEGKRLLVGLDFTFGYPAGFARALGLMVDRGAWRALHEYFASRVTDSAENLHNRDAFADECNRSAIGVGAPGPFLGLCCTCSHSLPNTVRHWSVPVPQHGLEEWRTTEIAARRQVTTQSVWKLNCGVSVSGQTILGIKNLDELARSVDGHRWPFDGSGVPDRPAIWLAGDIPIPGAV